MLSATILLLAWSVAQVSSERYVLQRMKHSVNQTDAAFLEINQQVKRALSALQTLKVTSQSCNPQLYAQISQLVANNRFIYEAAIQQVNGKGCSSYGYEMTNFPKRGDQRYFSSDAFDYWFLGDSTASKDNGFIIVAHGESYIWLNKGIILAALGLTDGLAFDLVDSQRLKTVFTSSEADTTIAPLPSVGVLSESGERIQYAVSNQWAPGLVSILSLPRSALQRVWWIFFVVTLVFSIVLPTALFLILRWARHRYFCVIAQLRHALKNDQLHLNYQPIVNTRSGEWIGMESLIRCNSTHPSLSPAIFIPAAERAGMIGEVTRWVVRQVAEDFSQYLWACKGLPISINLSAQDIEDESFAEFVRDLLREYEIPAHLISFEVTEGSLLNRKKAAVQLQRLREQGHRIAVDDFGTGYSSLAYIGELPIDILKIDRSFLPLEKMQADDSLWRHVVSMANTLKLTVIAEGVEQVEQAELLIKENVQYAQGWLYSKALPADVLAKKFFMCRG